MIRKVSSDDIDICVDIIRKSFQTVADEFDLTETNAPRFTAFATTPQRIFYHLEMEKRPMFLFFEDEKPVGYYSLSIGNDSTCELNNLSVLPSHRHKGIGAALLEHAFSTAKELGSNQIHIGIVEVNTRLKNWYSSFGFVHTGTEKFDFFPFTCGYMVKTL